MIDTHTHIYLEEFDEDRDETMQRAADAGVRHMIFPNVDFDTLPHMKALHNRYCHCTSMAMGLHPTSVDDKFREKLTLVENELHRGGYVAVGEIGMDLYWDSSFASQQRIALAEQMRMAHELSLPAIIHCREALDEIIEVLSQCTFQIPPTIFHSFTGSADDVRRLRQIADFHFGFNGIATFKNGHLEDTITEVGLSRTLLETDSPYLAPVPHRGRRNESAFLPAIARKIADTLNVDIETVKRHTTQNAVNIFKLQDLGTPRQA